MQQIPAGLGGGIGKPVLPLQIANPLRRVLIGIPLRQCQEPGRDRVLKSEQSRFVRMLQKCLRQNVHRCGKVPVSPAVFRLP